MTDLAHTQAPDAMWTREDDEAGKKAWTQWHDQRHETYRRRASQLGKALQGVILTGELDLDWFARHMFAHLALKGLYPRELGQLVLSLERAHWQGREDFVAWHRRHALLHARLDALLGVV